MREELTERRLAAEAGNHARGGLERPSFLSPLLGVQKRIAERTVATLEMKIKLRLYECTAWFANIDGEWAPVVMARDDGGKWYVIGVRK